MLGHMGRLIKIGKLQGGKTVKMSKAEIIDLVINLYYIKKEVTPEQYKEIERLYLEIIKEKKQIEMDKVKYSQIVDEIIAQFKAIAPISISNNITR